MAGVKLAYFVQENGAPVRLFQRPDLVFVAPVKAPFSCPNTSLSSRVSGMLAQLIFMNDFARLRLLKCTVPERKLFPAPVSPVMRIVASESAFSSTWR